MFFEIFYSLLFLAVFTTQYFINKKCRMAEEKPKESLLAAAALGLLPVVMVVLVFTWGMDKLPYLPVVLRGFALVLMAVWFVQNFSHLQALIKRIWNPASK